MRMRGSSEANGSWNTVWIRVVSLRPRAATGAPSRSTRPWLGIRMPAMTRPRVDLPQPDSPTRPSVSPRAIVSETSLTACTARRLDRAAEAGGDAVAERQVRREALRDPLDRQEGFAHAASAGVRTSG